MSQQKELLSLGIDIGTSTFHLIFSSLTLQEDAHSKSKKFKISERKILYESPIYFTPLEEGRGLIDYEALVKVLLDEYQKFGVTKEQIDTGAIIITGETARRKNAEEILHQLAKEAGDFVVATAGPNLESILAAKGSGAIEYSKIHHKTILSIDIGGGTSNIALIKDGKILETACINVGGRLVVTDEKNTIIRLEPAIEYIAEQLNIKEQITLGVTLPSGTKQQFSEKLANCLLEFITKRGSHAEQLSPLTLKLSQTPPLEYEEALDGILFSGGISEYIYKDVTTTYNDLGLDLAMRIKEKLKIYNLTTIEATLDQPIRATVIGAGQYSLQVSGSTTFLSQDLTYPIQNLPVVPVHIDRKKLAVDYVSKQIINSLQMFDLEPLLDNFCLAFSDPVRTIYNKLIVFGKGVEQALALRVQENLPIFLVFDTDIGNSVGNVIHRETSISSLLSIDEISLEEGDFIDIGKPIINDKVVPVVVKTLAFLK